MAASSLNMGPRAWLGATRVPTLPAAIVPVLVGSGLALFNHHFRPLLFIATLGASVLIQIGTNLANDYYDFRKGADTEDRVGPPRITASGLVKPQAVLLSAVVSFAFAAIMGIYLVAEGGWPILIIGVASIIAGLAYTAGPYPLGYHGLGDAFVFVFFGLVAVAGTYYLQTGTVTSTVFVAAIPIAFLVTAILVINNIRDVDTDRAVGKLTVAVRFGRRAARMEYVCLVLGAYAFPFVMAGLGAARWWLFWIPFISLPMGVNLTRTVSEKLDGPSLNTALKRTGQLHLLFGLLFLLSLTP